MTYACVVLSLYHFVSARSYLRASYFSLAKAFTVRALAMASSAAALASASASWLAVAFAAIHSP